MKTVLVYEPGTAPMEKIIEAFPRHKVVMDPLIEKKEVLGVGTFGGGKNGSMAIFRTREAAEAFVKLAPS